jgi:hypothetical protein
MAFKNLLTLLIKPSIPTHNVMRLVDDLECRQMLDRWLSENLRSPLVKPPISAHNVMRLIKDLKYQKKLRSMASRKFLISVGYAIVSLDA